MAYTSLRPLSAVILTLSLNLCAQAHAGPICEGVLFEPIPRTAMPGYNLEVRGPRGELAYEESALSKLKDGEYVYLITTTGTVAYSRKFDLSSYSRNGRGLITHKSLLLQLEENHGTDVANHIGAAGEFSIRNHRVAKVSNRSGNFRGFQAHFAFGEQALKERGLPIEAGTIRHILKEGDKEDRGHTPKSMRVDEYRLQTMSGLMASHFNRDMHAFFFELHRIMSEVYPSSIPGEIDTDGIYDLLYVPLIKEEKFAAGEAVNRTMYVLKSRNESDGMEAALIRVLFMQEDPDDTRLENDRRRAKLRLKFIEQIGAFMTEVARNLGREFEQRPDWYELRLKWGRLKGSVNP